jgi:isopenicillin N synthase-like dioxygenase
VLTILKQDDSGGLEVQMRDSDSGCDSWAAAPPLHNAFVINIGDMLERMTSSLYVSTPHRVRVPAPLPLPSNADAAALARGRLSFPFFFDPAWHARVQPMKLDNTDDDELFDHDADVDGGGVRRRRRWDGADVVGDAVGAYGEYLLAKVSKVFPTLFRSEALADE